MPIKTRRWSGRRKKDDGLRVLICRYRPRALPKENETWDVWYKELAPSKELHAAYYGKRGEPITWDEYRRLYLKEMEEQSELIAAMAELVAEGKTITLLCSSACKEESRCHRSLLRELIEAELSKTAPAPEAVG